MASFVWYASRARIAAIVWATGLPVLVSAVALQGSGQGSSEVELLKHPFPYRASLSILSDLHATTAEQFEAVHALVNGRDEIVPGSAHWRALGWDDSRETPPTGPVRGFGFPFADTFFPFSRSFGLFRGFDEQSRTLVPFSPDLSSKFVEWHRKGYVDAMHTFGSGRMSRAQLETITEWMREQLGRPITVHVNHSKAGTPVGVGGACCSLLNQTLVSLRYRLFGLVGLQRRLSPPKPLPRGLRPLGYGLLVCSFIGGVMVLATSRRSERASLRIVMLMTLAATPLVMLHFIPVEFYEGDNPDSSLYSLDLVRSLGTRFFWLGETDFEAATIDHLQMPESVASTGRPSVFGVHRFDDHSSGLTFVRSTIGSRAATLGLLRADSLDRFVDEGGRSILYLHWLSNPASYFNDTGRAHLSRLRQYADTQRIWVASAATLLMHAYAYAYVAYESERTGTHTRIEILGFDDPIEGRIAATPAALANLSFACEGAESLSIVIDGTSLQPEALSLVRRGSALVGTILPSPGPESVQ